MDDDRSKLSLRVLLETIKGPYPDLTNSDISELGRGLAEWYRFNYYMAQEHHRDELNGLMSVEQRGSYRLLLEWWTAAYQDSAYSLAAILDYTSHLEDLSGTNPGRDGNREENWSLVFQHLYLKSWPDGPIPDPEFTGRLWSPGEGYNALMESLFRLEFAAGLNLYPAMRDDEPPDITHYREYFREQGVRYAYCQEMGYKLFLKAYPEHRSEKCLLGKKGKPPGAGHAALTRGPVFNPCPWLERDKVDDLQNLPLYLWDVAQEKTIVSATLPNRPEYTAISHTWGRWIKGAPNLAQIPGARWGIPQNSRFEVRNLPQLLRRVPCGTPYVWLDLLCIPQYESPEQAREIGRQATIFRSAKHVVAWLNDTDTFAGLRLITQWQCLQLLRFSSEEQRALCRALVDDAGRNASGKQTGLMAPGAAVHRGVNAWFSSLWTLQEAAMRPDMWLCSRDWQPLTWDGGSPLPLSGVVAVTDVFNAESRAASGGRNAHSNIGTYQQLTRWSFLTGLERLLSLDRTSLISLGDRRECTGRRAEAIMSALGVTDWYEDALREGGGKSSDGRVADMVLGKYPRRFVQECAAKFPGEFFGSTLHISLNSQPGLSTEGIGTLLPFSRGHAYHMDAVVSRETRFPTEPHGSLRTWTILASGAVKVPQACVLCKSEIERTVATRARQSLARLRSRLPHSSKSDTYIMPEEDLQIYDSLEELHKELTGLDVEAYAVLTEFYFIESNGERSLTAMGIVLERSEVGRLRKRHNFWLCDQLGMVDVAKSEEVNWTVD
ncbi:hypothetical protein SLS57_006860 [Botryosphaeria dothidea]